MNRLSPARTLLLTLLLLLAVPTGTWAIKIVHGPYLQNVYQTEATIVWQSDKPSVGWVEIAPDDGTTYYAQARTKYYDTHIGIKRTSELHAVRLTGLRPGTRYRYRVYAKEVLRHEGNWVGYGRVAATDVFQHKPLSFVTLDANKQETSFVMLNDVHGRHDMITPLLQKADYKHRDVILYNGDMISITNSTDGYFTEFMDESIKLFASERCIYYVRGNHETRGEAATAFQDYFNPRQPHLYFSFRQGPVYFICLDTGEDKPDDDIEYAGITDYDSYRSEQAAWLKTLPSDPLYQSARWRIVVAHMPTIDDPSSWHGQMDCLKKFTPVLNSMDIDLMVCGHMHEDMYREPSQTVHYPVLVNSNRGILEAETEGNQLRVKVTRLDGKTVNARTYQARR